MHPCAATGISCNSRCAVNAVQADMQSVLRLLCADGHLPAGAEDTAVQCHHDHQSGQAAAGMSHGSCQSGGCSEVLNCGHLAAAVPLRPSQVQGVQPLINSLKEKLACTAWQAHAVVC